jgi:hypothetical protein
MATASRVQLGAVVAGFRAGLPVGVAQPFAHRIEGLARRQLRQQAGHGNQAARAGGDHAEAPQGQAHSLRLAERRKTHDNRVDPLVKFRLARHGGTSGKMMLLAPINLP